MVTCCIFVNKRSLIGLLVGIKTTMFEWVYCNIHSDLRKKIHDALQRAFWYFIQVCSPQATARFDSWRFLTFTSAKKNITDGVKENVMNQLNWIMFINFTLYRYTLSSDLWRHGPAFSIGRYHFRSGPRISVDKRTLKSYQLDQHRKIRIRVLGC